MQHDAWFFLGVFVFIFLIWVVTGGPTHPLSFAGPKLSQPEELGGGTYITFPRTTGGGGSNLNGSSGVSGTQGGSSNTGTYKVPVSGGTITVFGLPSPYQGIVTLSHFVSNASSTDAKNEYIQISVAQNASAPVDITGWIVGSDATGNAEVIPKGTRLPASGAVNAGDDIVLQPGERAYIISGESPVGASFAENKCIGYFSNFQKFTPSLPQNCPVPSTEFADYYNSTAYFHDPSCIDYTNSLQRCRVALSGVSSLTNTCRDFLEAHFNYNGCVQYHRNDPDFSGNTWHIYLGRDTHMWRARHEIVKLFDKRGKTVDLFAY